MLLAGGHVLDVGTGERVRRDLAITGGHVVDADGGADQIRVDVDGPTVMFGLWDVPAHPRGLMYDPPAAGYFERTSQHSVRAGANLVQAATMGITGVRTAAEADGIDMAWRDAFAAGRWPGPRVMCSDGAHGASS